MRYLLLLLRIFLTSFGLTQPKPEQERRMALFLAGLLVTLAAMIAGATWALLHLAA